MRKIFAGLLSAVLAVVGLQFMTAAPAAAGNCTMYVFCGWVAVNPDSHVGIRVTYTWGDKLATDRVIAPGDNSKNYGKDTDGMYTRKDYNITCFDGHGNTWLYPATGWHKITDTMHLNCRQYPEWM